MCRQLAAEWAPHKVNVNVLAPTFVRTEQVAKWLADPDFYKTLVARIPIGRIGETEDVVGAVLYLRVARVRLRDGSDVVSRRRHYDDAVAGLRLKTSLVKSLGSRTSEASEPRERPAFAELAPSAKLRRVRRSLGEGGSGVSGTKPPGGIVKWLDD